MKTSMVPNGEKSSMSSVNLIMDQEYGFYVADYFQEILYLERKRRERSGRPMLIMLFDIMRFSDREKNDLGKKLAHALFSLTRETDIKGWYSEENVIGTIFTEMNKFDKATMLKKIRTGLSVALEPSDMERIDISLHVFPQDGEKKSPDLPANPVIYSDVNRKYDSRKGPFLAKRAIDVIGSIVGLILFAPFFLIIPLLIKLTSPGPIFFRQERMGLYGKKFTFLKFRTMQVNNDPCVHQEYVKKLIAEGDKTNNGSDACQKPVYKITNDKRVTSIGRFLRKTSLDELPQFINVLCGDMSLVGPRPPIPYEVENYDIWHLRRVIEIKPGITGLWQVKGRSSTTFNEMVRLDIQYSKEWNLWLDLKILFLTPLAVFKGKGAY
jgi:exopolysaccharide biosynthesis polyprenyl glycosylphosphotransferase